MISSNFHGTSSGGIFGDWGHIHDVRYDAGLALLPHSHATAALCLIVNGGFRHQSGRREDALVAGSAFFLPSGVVHSNSAYAPQTICVRVELHQEWLSFIAEHSPLAVEPWTTVHSATTRHILRAYACGSWRSDAITAEEFLLSIFPSTNATVGRSHSAPPNWLVQARERILDAPEQVPSLRQFASDAGVHPVHMAAMFRRFYGCSAGELWQMTRIARGAFLLRSSRLSLARIASTLGFHDQSHFTRAFRSRVGVAPAQFRALRDNGAPNTD